MRVITIKLPQDIIDSIDELVISGKYKSRSQFIRTAIEELLAKDEWHITLMPGLKGEIV